MGLYRSKNDKLILGFCGGIGDKYAINTGLVRLIIVLAAAITVPIGPLFYFLALTLPEKQTSSERNSDLGKQSEGVSSQNNEESKNDVLMVAEGNTGQVELHEDKIKITRKGLMAKLNHWGKGTKEIRIENITSVQLKEPGMATAGFIQFGQSGYSESEGGVFSAAQDENSVNFQKRNKQEFIELREKIHDLRNKEKSQGSGSAMDKLKERFANGDITEEEFKRKKNILQD